MSKLITILIAVLCYTGFAISGDLKGSGGPDGGGYTWIDSDEASGPVYSWVEISSVGTAIGFTSADQVSASLDLGFNFPYYDSTFSTVKVYSKGYLSFDGPNYTENPRNPLPDTYFNYSMVAFLWSWLDPSAGGEIYYYQDVTNNRFIVQFQDIQDQDYPTDVYTCQVILNSDGTILFQYKEFQGSTEYITVGQQNTGGSAGITVVYQSTYLKNGLAVLLEKQAAVYGGEIELSVSSLDYGTIANYELATRSFTIKNNSFTQVLQGEVTLPAGFYVCAGSQAAFEIGTRDSLRYDVEFFPQTASSYNGHFVVTSTDAASSPDSIQVTAASANPVISTSVADTLEFSLLNGSVKTEYFDIINTSSVNLEHSVRYTQPSKAGGSDLTYGYTWKDSDETDGPDYYWKDIAHIGTLLNLGDEQMSGRLSMGFPVNYYGQSYDSVYVCSNGYLSFTSTFVNPTNSTLPGMSEPNNTLAVFWDDLNPALGGNIYYYYDIILKRFIVQYDRIQGVADGGDKIFQIQIYLDGTIVYQYRSLSGTLNSCTVGIENFFGDDGIQSAYNQVYLKNNLSIAYEPPKTGAVSVAPLKGYISGSSSKQIGVTFDSGGYAVGSYYSSIIVESNDSVNPSLTVPVKVNVYELTAPANLTTSVSGSTLTLNWDAVPYASSYKVYSSNDPYGTFLIDDTGSFSGSSWSTTVSNVKKFYRVTALDAKGNLIK